MQQDVATQAATITVRSSTLAPPANHTVSSLVTRHGQADRAAIEGFVWGVSTTELFGRGQRVSTARLLDEGVVILGDASDFLLTATPAQRALVVAISGPFLSAACSAMLQAEQVSGRLTRRQSSQRSQRKVKDTAASKAMNAGRARREIYRSNLIAQCGDDTGWKGRIDDACAAVSTPTELADSLDTMVREGRALVSHLTSEKRQCAISSEWLQAITEDARKMREAAKPTVGTSSKLGLRRGDLDWWEGVALWFLKCALDVFAKAHAVDPSIPKLSPGALRSTLTPNHTRKRKVAAKPVTPPVTG